MRRAFTLLELLLVLTIVALTTAVGLRQAHAWLDRSATRAAILDAGLTVGRARDAALSEHTVVTLRIDTAAGVLTLSARGTRFASRLLTHAHDVRIASTRDSVSFDVRGLGYGAANFTLVARRGSAADTLVVSRLGRVR
jgi:prepilin-type N-terminal cleavage/methylation domain-containing protein